MNRGIGEAHRRGILTSASLLANGPAFASAVELARAEPALGIGVHLNLSDGPPVLSPWDVPSLIAQERKMGGGPGSLYTWLLLGRLDPGEVEREWDAQIRKVRDAGISPTHLDGHKHVHMIPGLFEIALRLARRHGIPAIRISHESPQLRAALSAGSGFSPRAALQRLQGRFLKLLTMNAAALARGAGIASPGHFCGITQTGLLTEEGVATLLHNLPEGTTELMTHPGEADEELHRGATRLRQSRHTELFILTSPAIRNLVASQGIRLLHYGSVVLPE
ncbi:MAG: ChbG/HpnK family deacetylase [Acidobacteriia bacterium]|nr:ChbG/HpnK family deacetylase [Terriglobia bacterium]